MSTPEKHPKNQNRPLESMLLYAQETGLPFEQQQIAQFLADMVRFGFPENLVANVFQTLHYINQEQLLDDIDVLSQDTLAVLDGKDYIHLVYDVGKSDNWIHSLMMQRGLHRPMSTLTSVYNDHFGDKEEELEHIPYDVPILITDDLNISGTQMSDRLYPVTSFIDRPVIAACLYHSPYQLRELQRKLSHVSDTSYTVYTRTYPAPEQVVSEADFESLKKPLLKDYASVAEPMHSSNSQIWTWYNPQDMLYPFFTGKIDGIAPLIETAKFVKPY